MIKRLDSANDAVDKVIDTYKAGTTGCVEKIKRRLNKERDSLSKQWDDDGKRFHRSVEESKEALKSGTAEKKNAMSKLEQDSKERQMLYDQASSSLRAFQRHILSGRDIERAGVH